jgi:large subunit ribosomal protein L9
MKQNLLLVSDVEDLGKIGEVVTVKSGYARNYLLPKKKAIIADKHTLLMQKKLKEERSKQAITDKSDSQELAKIIEKLTLSINVKVDPEGKLYGSVGVTDIIDLLKKEGIEVSKKNVLLKKPIKETGVTNIELKLKEDVIASFSLKIIPEDVEGGLPVVEKEVSKEIEEQRETQE